MNKLPESGKEESNDRKTGFGSDYGLDTTIIKLQLNSHQDAHNCKHVHKRVFAQPRQPEEGLSLH